MKASLPISLAGVPLQSPIIAAAGTSGYVAELSSVLDVSCLGAITTKSITREPRTGNQPWRVIDVPHGMLNAIGLANVGLDRFVAEKLPAAEAVDAVIIGSIAGHSLDDYLIVATAFDAAPALPFVELNVSCPNTADGLQFGESPAGLTDLLRHVRPALTQTRLIVKLSPNVGDMVGMARAAIDAGADVLTIANTFTAMSINVETRTPRLSRGMGGLSGPGIHPIVVQMIRAVYEGVARDANVPIIGLGGVMTWRDAAEFVLAGATAVGMGTAIMADPHAPKHVSHGLATWMRRQGASSINGLIGAAEAP